MATLALAKQRRGRKLVVLVALRNLGLADLLGRRFFRVTVKNENRSLEDTGLAVLLFGFLLFRTDGQGAARFEKSRFADFLRRHRLSSGDSRLFNASAHAFLLAPFAPIVPTRLHFLEEPKAFDGTDGALGPGGPGMRAGKRKSRGHKQRGEEQGHGHKQRSPKIEPGKQFTGNQRADNAAGGNGSAYRREGKQRQERRQRNQQ